MSHKLMIKTHDLTGLKYLCYTRQRDHEKYLGSGKYWLDHLNVHGKHITTELIFETDDLDLFKSIAKQKSHELNVVASEEWANLKDEEGDGGDTVSNKRWITDGVQDRYILKTEAIPEEWRPGRSRCIFNDRDNQKKFSSRSSKNQNTTEEGRDAISRANSLQTVIDGITYPSRKAAQHALQIYGKKFYQTYGSQL